MDSLSLPLGEVAHIFGVFLLIGKRCLISEEKDLILPIVCLVLYFFKWRLSNFCSDYGCMSMEGGQKWLADSQDYLDLYPLTSAFFLWRWLLMALVIVTTSD